MRQLQFEYEGSIGDSEYCTRLFVTVNFTIDGDDFTIENIVLHDSDGASVSFEQLPAREQRQVENFALDDVSDYILGLH